MKHTHHALTALLLVLTASISAYSQTKTVEPDKAIEQTITAGETHFDAARSSLALTPFLGPIHDSGRVALNPCIYPSGSALPDFVKAADRRI